MPRKVVDRAEALRWTVNMAAKEFGIYREKFERNRRVADIQPGEDGKFSTQQVASIIFGSDQAQANLDLTRAREAEIKLNMEVTRKQRPKIEDVEAEWTVTLSNVAGILRGYRKQIGEDCLGEIFAALRIANGSTTE